MNTTMLNRTVLAVVIGSALGFGLGAPTSAHARDTATKGQPSIEEKTDEQERGRKKREREEARDQQTAENNGAAAAEAKQKRAYADVDQAAADANRGREQAQARQQETEQRQAQAERDRGAQRDARQQQFREQQDQREAKQQAQREQQARQASQQEERSRERQDRYTPQPQPQAKEDGRPPADRTPGYRLPSDRTGDDSARNKDDGRRSQWGNDADTRRRIDEQRNQAERYARAQQAAQDRARRDAINLQNQSRSSQYRYHQDYYSRLRQYNQRYDWQRYDYNNDPYFYTAPSYRYQRDGRYYNINRYAADMLQQAINYGYAEGTRAGRADRYDDWRYSYRDSFAYIDASYGYRGMYVSQFDYNYYFRQGFKRGYEDGYYGRRRYGRQSNGSDALFGTVLSLILNLQPYRY